MTAKNKPMTAKNKPMTPKNKINKKIPTAPKKQQMNISQNIRKKQLQRNLLIFFDLVADHHS